MPAIPHEMLTQLIDDRLKRGDDDIKTTFVLQASFTWREAKVPPPCIFAQVTGPGGLIQPHTFSVCLLGSYFFVCALSKLSLPALFSSPLRGLVSSSVLPALTMWGMVAKVDCLPLCQVRGMLMLSRPIYRQRAAENWTSERERRWDPGG